MKLMLCTTIGALLAVPAYALAQQAPRADDPADPRAAVPPAVYESAIPDTPPSAPERGAPKPDKLWRKANDTVAGAPAHAAHERNAESNAAAPNGGSPSALAAPASSAQPVDQAAADHGNHH